MKASGTSAPPEHRGLREAAIRAQAALLSPNERRREALDATEDGTLMITENDAVAAARQAGALTIALSSFFRSPLVTAVDVAIVTGNWVVSFNEQAMAARTAQLAALDALTAAAALATRPASSPPASSPPEPP